MKTKNINPYTQPSDGPWIRRYQEWAQPYYDKMQPDAREELVAFDRWLYSRSALGFWLGVGGGLAGLMAGLYFAGAPMLAAFLLTLLVGFACVFAAVNAWFSSDEKKATPGLAKASWRNSPWYMVVLIPAAVLLGLMVGDVPTRVFKSSNEVTWDGLVNLALNSLQRDLPYVLALAGAVMGSVAVTLLVKQQRLKAQVDRLKLLREREQLTAATNQAQLKLLQAQIKPHFLFNTLAALQHWTDVQDPRASQLLQSLTAFLRRSTDTMTADWVPLGTELALVQDYLGIMQHRMGAKLQHQVDVPTALLNLQIPPALLLSLIENAIEHGIAPSLSGGVVRVSAMHTGETARLVVHNTGSALNTKAPAGVGLNNTRARLLAHFGAEASLELMGTPEGTTACICLPFSDQKAHVS